MHKYPTKLLHIPSHAIPPDMTVVMVFDLIITFTVLTAIIIVALLLYFLLQYLKRRRAQRTTTQAPEETDHHGPLDGLSRRLSRRLCNWQIPTERDIEQQRMSMKTPPLELLPEIETSDDRAIEWLEKGKCKEVRFEDVGVDHPSKAYQVMGVKGDGDFRWDWSGRQTQRMEALPQIRPPGMDSVRGSN